MTEDDWDFFNKSVGKLEKEVITLKKENSQLKYEYEKECKRADELEDSYWKTEKEHEKLKKQLEIIKKYLTLIKRNVSVGSLAYTYVSNAQTDIKELEK